MAFFGLHLSHLTGNRYGVEHEEQQEQVQGTDRLLAKSIDSPFLLNLADLRTVCCALLHLITHAVERRKPLPDPKPPKRKYSLIEFSDPTSLSQNTR